MAANFDRSEIMRSLSILYPPEHGIIELVAIKKDGYLLSSRFTDREKMVDEIAKYDRRDDVAAIYTTLNKLDEGTFQREGHVLSVDTPLASGPRVDSGNVARVAGILFDIDPFRANGDKTDSTTDSEHQAAIEAADFLKRQFSSMGWAEPVVGSSGNGAALRYSCDLPASKESTKLLSRVLKAANEMLPKKLAAQVEVDPAVFDLPRISKVFGTMTRKGPGTTERPHRRAAIISAPERLEPVKLYQVILLAEAVEVEENTAPREHGPQHERGEKVEPLSEDAAERLQELFAADPTFKADFTTPAPVGKRSDAEFHFCARLWEAGFSEAEIYAIMTSSPQTKWLERDDNYRWETIRKAVAKSEASHRESTGPTPEQIVERIKENRDALKDPVILAAMAALKGGDPVEYDILIDDIKGAVRGARVAVLRARVDKFIAEQKKADSEYVIPPGVLAEANKILDEGRGFEYAYQVWQKRHHGDANLGKGLFLSVGAQSCISSKGVHIHACGPRGSGKSDGAEKASEAIPGSHLLVGSASPKALYYLGEQLPAGSVVYLDDIGWNDQAAQMFKTCTTFYREGATHTVVVDQEIMQFKTAPRIIFWLTTADDQTDEQIRDRLLRIDTTETATHTKEVVDFIFQQRKSGAAAFDSSVRLPK